MSGPHQPGWSDEELIALSDLHVSRKALDAASSQNGSPAKGRPAPRQQQNTQGQPRSRQQTQSRGQGQQPRTTQQQQSQQQRPVPRRDAQQPQQQRAQAPQQPEGRHARPVITGIPDVHSAHGSNGASGASGASVQNRVATQVAETVSSIDANIRKLLPGGVAPVNEQVLRQIRYPLHGATVGVFARKGGVGKTTVTAYLALTFATIRDGHIIAVDSDHEDGSLGWLLAPEAPSTLEQLADVNPLLVDPRDFARYINRTMVGLDVILNDSAHEAPINDSGLSSAIKNLSKNYDVSVFDTGSATMHSAGRTLLNRSRVHLLVTGPSIDSIRAAERTLTWLEEREDARANPTPVIAVINGIPSHLKTSQIERMEEVFAERCAAVVRIPFDDYLSRGTTSASIEQLSKPAQVAFQQLAATTVHVLTRSMTRAKGLINQ